MNIYKISRWQGAVSKIKINEGQETKIERALAALEVRVLTTGPPGKILFPIVSLLIKNV